MTPKTKLTLAFTTLSCSFVTLSSAQQPAAKPATPPEPQVEIRAAEPVKEAPKVQIRSAALPSTKPKAATPLGTKEQTIVKNLPSMNLEQLREMAEVYTRVGNQRMAQMLIGEITRRDPKATDLATLQADLLPDGAEDDPAATKAQELYAAGKSAEAAAVLQKLKNEKYRGQQFRYQQDLAYALMESGQEAAAQAAFQELLRSRTATSEERADAKKSLAGMALDALQAKGQAALTARDARQALEAAEQLLAKNPNDPEAMALKTAALSLTGHNAEAIALLESLRAKAGKGRFPHQKALGDAYYDAQNLAAAEAAYQVILDQPGYDAEDRVDARTRLADMNRDRLLLQGERALIAGKISRAETIAVQLELERPVHPDAKAFRAAVLNKQRRYSEAKAILESMLADAKHPFEANVELADTYANTGNWAGAAAQYAVAENDPRNAPTERFDAARMGREMLGRYRPTVTTNYEAESGGEGNVWRAATEASTGDLGGGNIFMVRGNWDQIYLKGERAIARQEADRFQAELAYRRLIANGFFGEASVGGSDNDVVYGAKFGRYEGPGMAWEISYRGNDRATDSLALEALNGRQNVVSMYLGTHFSKRFFLDSHLFFRQVTIDGQTLGQGWGFDMNIGYTFVEETSRRPELAISYFNEISRFSGRSLGTEFERRYARKGSTERLSEGLIDRAINRHGVIITLSKQLTHRVNAYVYGGVSYEFENAELEGRAGAGIEAYLSPNASLTIGLDYTTSGNAGNRGSDVLSGNVGVKMSF
jgi:hypothetical protein